MGDRLLTIDMVHCVCNTFATPTSAVGAMMSIAKTRSAFTSQSIAACERVVSVYFFIVLYLSTT